MNISKRVRRVLFAGFLCLALFNCLFTNASWLYVFGQAFAVAITYLLFFPLWPKVRKVKLVINNKGVINVLTVFIIGTFVLAFVWYLNHKLIEITYDTHTRLTSDMGTNSTIQEGIATFLINLDTYLLILCVVILGLWVLQRSQKRGELAWQES